MLKDTLKLGPLLLSVCAAVFAFFFIYNTLQYTAQRVELLGFYPGGAEVTVNNVSNNGHIEEFGKITFEANDEIQRISTQYVNKHIHRLQLEIDNPGNALINLSRIQIFYPYLETYYINNDNIIKHFNSDQRAPQNPSEYLGENIIITSNDVIAKPSSGMALLISALIFIGTFVLTRNLSLSNLPAFADLKLGNRISSTEEFDMVNGIRGLAAVLVLLSHAAPRFEALQMGLSFLFVISGFLLAKPFVLDPQKIFNFANIEHFLLKRIQRILPMYYFYGFILFGFTVNLEGLARHLLFLQGDMHLWAMTQIFLFYMLLPLILIFTSFAHRLHRLAPIALLSCACYFSLQYFAKVDLFYNGRYFDEFHLFAFILGVLASYLHFDILVSIRRYFADNTIPRQILGVMALILTIYVVLWSGPMKPYGTIFEWINQFWIKNIMSAIIIILALTANKSILSIAIGNPILRSVGVIGFSFYILHGLGMEIYTEIQRQVFVMPTAGERSWDLVLGAFVITYILSLLTYSYVERPFFGKHRKSKKT